MDDRAENKRPSKIFSENNNTKNQARSATIKLNDDLHYSTVY